MDIIYSSNVTSEDIKELNELINISSEEFYYIEETDEII